MPFCSAQGCIHSNDQQNVTESFIYTFCFSVTNPIDVIKVRLQLDNELASSKNILNKRKYRGFLHGGIVILKEEGISGLFKGYVFLICLVCMKSSHTVGSKEEVVLKCLSYLFNAIEY